MSVTSLSRAGMGMLSSCITFQLRISPELGEGENGAERCGHQVMFRNLSSSHPCWGIPAILTGCQTKRVSGDQSRQLPHFQMRKQARQRKRLALELTEGRGLRDHQRPTVPPSAFLEVSLFIPSLNSGHGHTTTAQAQPSPGGGISLALDTGAAGWLRPVCLSVCCRALTRASSPTSVWPRVRVGMKLLLSGL